MSVLAEVQPRVHSLTGGLFANWMPSDQVDVGDYGVIARERFVRDGNLRNYQLAFSVETPEKSKGKLEYSDRARFSTKLAAKGAVHLPGLPPPKASAEIAFTGKGAFLYHLSGITTRRLKNSRSFFQNLACKWIAGDISLEENAVIVNEIRVADKATIVVSEGRDGLLKLQGNFSTDGQAVLADVKGGLSVASSSGSMFQFLGAEGTVPIIGLVRPVMGPPPGGGDVAVASAGPSFFQQVRALFQRNKWDIRDVQLRGYASSADETIVTVELPHGEVVAVAFSPVTAEQFMRLNDSAPEAHSYTEESVPTVAVTRTRSAGA
jgi:hypothetical protein